MRSPRSERVGRSPAPSPPVSAKRPGRPSPGPVSSLAPPTRDGLQARLDRAALLGHRPAGATVQRADVKLDRLSLDVVLFYTKLDPATLRLIKDTPEESFALFYDLEPEAQIQFLRGLQQLARLALQALTRSSGSRPMLEGGSASARQPFDVGQAYRGFLQLNPNFVGELLNLATGGTATIHGLGPQGGQRTLVLGGGLQALTGGGLLALTGPEVGTPTTSTGLVTEEFTPSPRPLSPSLSHELGSSLPVTGLASRLSLDRFTRAALALQEQWTQLDPQERARRMVTAANQELAELGIPPCGVRLVPKSALGELSHGDWVMELQETVFKRPLPTREELADLADTVYHEARHAEQFFRIVGYLSLKGKSKGEIEKETGIPSKVVEAGYTPSARPQESELKEARQWHRSIFGKDAGKRLDTLLRYRKIKGELAKLQLACSEKVKERRLLRRQLREGTLLLAAAARLFKQVDPRVMRFRGLTVKAVKALTGGTLDKAAYLGKVKGWNVISKDVGIRIERCHKEILRINGIHDETKVIIEDLSKEIETLAKSLEECQKVYQVLYLEYRQLPEEEDAWNVGNRVSANLLKAIPEISEEDQFLKEFDLIEVPSEVSLEVDENKLGEGLEETGTGVEDLALDLDVPVKEEVDEPYPFTQDVLAIETELTTLEQLVAPGLQELGQLNLEPQNL